MVSNKNIFYATNPAKILDALWQLINTSGIALPDILIFLPSRRAIRTTERMLVQKHGHAIILPHMVALGSGVDDADEYESTTTDTVSNTERVVVLAKLLSADNNIGNIATALPVAHDLVRLTDYLENEGVDVTKIDWTGLVDENFAEHFKGKARILQILSQNISAITHGLATTTQKRNGDIRSWIDFLKKQNSGYKLVIVCGSTASVPAAADLMAYIAGMPNGKIILSGKIAGRESDFELPTNPYCSEYKFLKRIGVDVSDVQPIDVGDSATIDFMNSVFGNDPKIPENSNAVSHCHLIECDRESVEALAVSEIVEHALRENKSVLIITPDAAGNQRIASAFAARNIAADFSGGRAATMHIVGRAILNAFDDWIEHDKHYFDEMYASKKCDLFETILQMTDNTSGIVWTPNFDTTDNNAIAIWVALRELSDALKKNDIVLSTSDARAFIADTLSGVVIREPPATDTHVCVLGTIESRMQTADVIIMTGLNEEMFPARGYENTWLPRAVAEKIGLPSPDRKVSLMSLDFMNLSCGNCVYWLRSTVSGGAQTTESRFISRVMARGGKFDTNTGKKIVFDIHARDNIELKPLDYSAPTPPADWSDVYVTDVEYLIHNPYAFYARHILKLSPVKDYWLGPDARDFGTMIHAIIRDAKPGDTPAMLVARLDVAAMELLKTNGVLFRFWHKRFLEMAPVIANELISHPNASSETHGSVKIPVGTNGATRTVHARADRVADGMVMDIKTGTAPTESQLKSGTMPQLPLEALMLQSGGFKIPTSDRSKTPVMIFLQLQNNNVKPIEYDPDTTRLMIRAAVDKTTEMFNIFTAGNAPYEYHETGDNRYSAYDDLARVNDV